jgi:hypothetical protein
MKRIMLILILVFVTYIGYSQKFTATISAEYSFSGNDTSISFLISSPNIDSCREKLIRYWGAPLHNNACFMIWGKIKIDSVGENLTINLNEGIITYKRGKHNFIPFTDEADKANKINDIKHNRCRGMIVTICNKDSNNIINSRKRGIIMMDIFESAFLPKKD